MLEDKLDFKFGENNALFAGRFCKYYPDLPDKTQEEEIFEDSIFVTKSRKKVLSEIFQMMKSDFKVVRNKSEILLDGPEGRGKTYTLLLLAHLLRKSEKVFLVYFQNSKQINKFGWNEICEQFEFAMNEKKEKEKIGKLKKADEISVKTELNNILEDYQANGYLTILMIDQLNFLMGKAQSIVADLFTMSRWDVELCSQSANNKPKDNFIEDSKSIFCPELMNQKEIQTLLEDYLQKPNNNNQNFEINKDDFENFIQYTGCIPREVIRLIKSQGNSMDEKVKNYINKRSEELLNNHEKFRDLIIGDIKKNKLNIAAFYADTNIPVFLQSDPFVDRQIMIMIKEEIDQKRFYL